MGKVVNLNNITRLDLSAERILKAASDENLDGVVIMGYTKDGQEYFSSSYADGGMILWLMERVKLGLMKVETTIK